ncbi:MAG: beta-N-acetylhexosaminidase [Moraxellaceae bacterium]|nr:MAG: beta-N-acetylhexosaminidase [Moraxellaceae bacterium]
MKKLIFRLAGVFLAGIFCAEVLAQVAGKNLSQSELAEFAKNTELKFGVISNFDAAGDNPKAHLLLTNKSAVDLPAGEANWRIYIHSMRSFNLPEGSPIQVKRIAGDLTELAPTKAFRGLAKGAATDVVINVNGWMVTYNDFMPRAFITQAGLTPEVFANTDTEKFENFVDPFTRQEQELGFGKRGKDLYPVATAASRYQDNLAVNSVKVNAADVAQRIIPQPTSVKVKKGTTRIHGNWQIRFAGELTSEATYFQQQLEAAGLKVASESDDNALAANVIQLAVRDGGVAESYELSIDENKILITGSDAAGVFYGIQSLLSLLPAQRAGEFDLPRLTVVDSPRYSWRGMHYDMARNFHGKAVIFRLMEQMAHVKLNKLHVHLTEDEGWRIEIPGLPELTEVGGSRCFDLTEQRCLLTQLGTGPHKTGSGNGFYTTQDFIEILKFAKVRHIDVVPEVDMPGHARAAIKSMEARYKKLMAAGKKVEAEQYLLSDPLDKSKYASVQSYTDNAINVCLPSTYVFAEKVIYEIQHMYRTAGAKLTTFHMGGDEVGKGAWQDSPACQALFASGQVGVTGVSDLKPYFVGKIANITSKRGLSLAGWEDGLMYDPVTAFNRKQFENDQVVAMAWDNIWEAGVADRANRLANEDYKVVLVPSTHLYLDHPYEAHPEERGAYWATRYSDTQKVFNFMPDNYYANADKTAEGKNITNLEALVGRKMPKLNKPENILGMQGAVWTEFIRTPEQLEQMIYPRVMALAERAWYKAPWEADKPNVQARINEWAIFSQALTQRVLPKLANSSSSFYLPPPGGVVQNGKLMANSGYPGLVIEYSVNGGATWLAYKGAVEVSAPVQLRVRLGNNFSRSTAVSL